jgi:hypothetical protein
LRLVSGEQAGQALVYHDRVDQEMQFVEQTLVEQPPGSSGAARHDEVAVALGLDLGHLRRTSPLRMSEFCQSALVKLVETTYFLVALSTTDRPASKQEVEQGFLGGRPAIRRAST